MGMFTGYTKDIQFNEAYSDIFGSFQIVSDMIHNESVMNEYLFGLESEKIKGVLNEELSDKNPIKVIANFIINAIKAFKEKIASIIKSIKEKFSKNKSTSDSSSSSSDDKESGGKSTSQHRILSIEDKGGIKSIDHMINVNNEHMKHLIEEYKDHVLIRNINILDVAKHELNGVLEELAKYIAEKKNIPEEELNAMRELSDESAKRLTNDELKNSIQDDDAMKDLFYVVGESEDVFIKNIKNPSYVQEIIDKDLDKVQNYFDSRYDQLQGALTRLINDPKVVDEADIERLHSYKSMTNFTFVLINAYIKLVITKATEGKAIYTKCLSYLSSKATSSNNESLHLFESISYEVDMDLGIDLL